MALAGKRRVLPVIVTDRAVLPGCYRYEWTAAADLMCWYVPAHFDGNTQPIYILYQNPSHLKPLLAYAIALAQLNEIDRAELDPERIDARACNARLAMGKIHQVKLALAQAWEDKSLPPEVAQAAMARLDKGPGYQDPISSTWVTATVMFATMVIDSIRHLETRTQVALFGQDQRGKDQQDQERKRAKAYFQKINTRSEIAAPDQPPANVAADLSVKLLQSLLPHLLPGCSLPDEIDLTRIVTLTNRGVPVSFGSGNSGYATSRRSANPVPGAACAA